MRHPEEINGRREAAGLHADGSPVMVPIAEPVRNALQDWYTKKNYSDRLHLELTAVQHSRNGYISDLNSRQKKAYAASDQTREAMLALKEEIDKHMDW